MAGDEPLKAVRGEAGDPMFEACFELVEIMRAATAQFMTERFADPRDGLTCLMSAASVFSGAQAGVLMSLGAFKTQDKRRISAAAQVNFKQGIDFGLRHGLRVASDQFGGRA